MGVYDSREPTVRMPSWTQSARRTVAVIFISVIVALIASGCDGSGGSLAPDGSGLATRASVGMAALHGFAANISVTSARSSTVDPTVQNSSSARVIYAVAAANGRVAPRPNGPEPDGAIPGNDGPPAATL